MDLVATQHDTRLDVDADALINVIISAIAPDTWEFVGGNGSLEWHERTGALVCTQTWQVHQQVESLLDSLRQSRDLQKIDWSRVRSVRSREDAAGFQGGAVPPVLRGGFFHVDDSPWRKPRVHD
jgi:hypothetical protein